jgi:DNA polymerase-4
MARGIDNRRLTLHREPKSVGQERTFARDLDKAQDLEEQLLRMSQGVSQRLKSAGLAAGTVAIKLRYADFVTLSRQMSLAVPTDDEQGVYQAAVTLLRREWQGGRPVRLLGVTARQLTPPAGQLPLFGDGEGA